MTIAAVLAAIAALGTIFGVFKYWTQLVVFFTKKTQAQKEQDIQKTVSDEKHDVDAGGRPKWG